MSNRRDWLRLLSAGVFAAVLFTVLATPPAAAQQAFKRFFPLLIDLAGWDGATPDGISMEMPGNNVLAASRDYSRGDSTLNVQVLVGPAAQGALAATSQVMKVETADGRMSASTIDGMQVIRTYTISDKSGNVLVGLGPSALFSLSFSGVGDDEALALARKFDWKAIQAAIPK